MAGERRYDRSHHVLYHIYRFEKRRSLEADASAIGVPLSTMDNYVSGVSACPVEVFVALYEHTNHPMIRDLLTPHGHDLRAVEHGSLSTLPSVAEEFLEDHQAVATMCALFKQYTEDGNLDIQELRSLEVASGDVITAVQRTILKIKEEAVTR